MSNPELKVLLSTAPDRESAERIATGLLAARLAACVQLLPGLTSLYHWRGKLERAEEILIVAKTCRPESCLARLAALHPYETPEGLILPVESGLEAYLAWAAAESAAASD